MNQNAFMQHIQTHLATLLAIQGAKDSGCPVNLEGMIVSAVKGTWDYAVEYAARIAEEDGVMRTAARIRELKSPTES